MIAYDIFSAEPVQRQKSPLEDGVWLMPANTTDVKPPKFNAATKNCTFVEGKWVVSSKKGTEPEEPETADLIPNQPTGQTQTPDPEYVPDYRAKRMDEYGDTYAQLQFITENGLNAWQKKVAEIKKKYPKG